MGDLGKARPELITTYGESSPFAETYRILQVNLLQRNGKPLWSLGITGVGPQHGGTTTAANLGLIMAETGKRVVLVDADLYKPSLHQLFGISNEVGFSSVLQGVARVEHALQPTANVPSLRILPAGPKGRNPAALIQPGTLNSFLTQLKGDTDFLILDLPSVDAIAYTSFVASFLEGLLLVVRAGTTADGVDRIMKRRLRGVNVVGVVLNQVPVDESEMSAYRYYARSKS